MNRSAYLVWRRLALVGLAGVSLRITVLAVPPLLPRIQHALGLNETGLAALTTLPVLLLAAGAPLGSAIVSRVGPRTALLWALSGIALFGALRGLGTQAWALFLSTFLMGITIAAVQPALPALVQRWLPRAVGRATATYTFGLLAGEMLAASLTLPLVLPLTGGWRAALAAWSVPTLVTVIALGIDRPPGRDETVPVRGRWWPDWRSRQTWWLGGLQGAGSTLYFAANAFAPTYLHASGLPGLVGPTLTVLNTAQLPAPLLLAWLPTRHATGPLSVGTIGVIGLAGVALVLTGHSTAVLAGAALIGLAAAGCLTVTYTLPAVLAGPGEAHRLSAGMFTIGYGQAFLLPLIGGAIWDATRVAGLAFVPAIAAGASIIAIAPILRRRGNG